MSVYRPKGSETYVYDFQRDGRRFSSSTGCKSRREAELVERAAKDGVRKEAEAAKQRTNQPMTLDLACARYWIEAGQYAKNTKQVEWSSNYVLKHLGEDTRICDLTQDMIAGLVAKRRSDRVDNIMIRRAAKTATKRVSNATVNRSVIEPLRRILRRAAESWGQSVPPIKWRELKLKEPKERVRYMSEAEEAAIFAVLSPTYHAIVRFALVGGCRANECCGLKWTDIDWGGRRVSIRGKGGKVSPIPLSAEMREFLWPLRGDHHIETAVFRNEAGAPVTYRAFFAAFARACQRAGVTNLRLHDLRHTAATRILRDTGNLKIAQKLLRHEDITTTGKYAHVLDDDVRDAMDALAAKKVPGKSPGPKRKMLK
ncbi:MAG: site-specific integrase [Beijerinckiaceae bacterium]|nr:site-specific integrase [Beijerinckiaceae bacterium]